MKRFFLILILILVSISVSYSNDVILLKNEAKRALDYLNLVRSNPEKFSKIIGIDLSGVKERSPLIWNKKLERSAQKKALDMASRNYIDHFTPEGVGPVAFAEKEGYVFPINWPDTEKNNYIESISAGSSKSGVEHIQNLIYDKGYPNSSSKANHRKHILGINQFWSKHIHVGIGFAYSKNTKYKGYLVIHTGVPGNKSVEIKGRVLLPEKYADDKNFEVWVGLWNQANDKKYWSKIFISPRKRFQTFSIRVPVNSKYILRYYKQINSRKYIRGYYSKNGTVSKMKDSDLIIVKNENIENLVIQILPIKD